MKTYVITLSRTFPVTHPRKGEQTLFAQKFHNALHLAESSPKWNPMQSEPLTKFHTIRANYPLWRKRFDEIEKGVACLSIRQWTGKPYASKQIEIARLTKDDGIGIQKMEFLTPKDGYTKEAFVWISGSVLRTDERERIARLDGLMLSDWDAWFAGYDKTQPLAVIHFTKFRY